MRRLTAGPWFGEFGWELMCWQGFLRQLSDNYDHVTVCAPAQHEALYTDFADVFISHKLDNAADCWRGLDHKGEMAKIKLELRALNGELVEPTGLVPLNKQRFVKFGDATRVKFGAKFDVLIHARGTFGKHKHGWSPAHCDQVVKLLQESGVTVGAIGTRAHCPDAVADYRNFPLQEVMHMMAAAKVVIGPSSGPLHLASLCGTRHVVWTDSRRWSAARCTNRQRYESVWNPLGTPCHIIDQYGWMPPVNEVLKTTLEALTQWKPSPQSLPSTG